jgi:hypothetical protein
MSLTKPSPEFVELLKKSGSNNRAEAELANYEIARALEMPLRQGMLTGDIAQNIFERICDDSDVHRSK